jgi:hypothetical protein
MIGGCSSGFAAVTTLQAIVLEQFRSCIDFNEHDWNVTLTNIFKHFK